MPYQTFYRKYRPKTFSLVYGQDTIVKTLKNIIKNNKLGHAYLFTGPRGTGKTSCAKIFAKAINCTDNNDGDACNQCEQCIGFNNNSNPDIIEIDAASNNGVDEIREIKSKVNLVPSISKYKVYIIDEVHMLSIGAFNALLKTLEEPPEYIIFILATTEPQKLPTTVISRCQRFDFKSISPDKMKECLKNIIENENIVIDEQALDSIIINSKGGLRDAIGMLDQANTFSDGRITIEDIDELSGNVSDDAILELFSYVLNGDYKNINNIINGFSFKGKDFSLILLKMISFIKNVILSRKIDDYDKINEKIIKLFQNIEDDKLYIVLDYLSEELSKMNQNFQKDISFEIKLIQIIDFLKSNVPRETSEHKEINVPRETLKKETNAPIENKKEEKNNKIFDKKLIDDETDEKSKKIINRLKNVRINNILKESSKNEISFINDIWQNINDFLIDDDFKISAGILVEGKPVAASSSGIIVTLPSESLIKRIETHYDESKNLISKIYNSNYKMVYITEENWQKIRPEYVIKAKNKELELMDEKELLCELNKLKNKKSVDDFYDLIEMEEK